MNIKICDNTRGVIVCIVVCIAICFLMHEAFKADENTALLKTEQMIGPLPTHIK